MRQLEVDRGEQREEGKRLTHEEDDMHVLRVLAQDVVHEIEAVQAHEAAQDLVVGRHLDAREELLEDAARLERLPDRRRHLGDLVELDRMQGRLRNMAAMYQHGRPRQEDDEPNEVASGTHRKVLVELLALLLLVALELELLDLVRDAERVDVEVVHAADVGLRLAADEADAVGLAAEAFLRDVAAREAREGMEKRAREGRGRAERVSDWTGGDDRPSARTTRERDSRTHP